MAKGYKTQAATRAAGWARTRRSVEEHGHVYLNGSMYAHADPWDSEGLRVGRAICHIEPEDNERAFDDPFDLGDAGFQTLVIR